MQISKKKYELLLSACEHASKSIHHPACKCHGEYSANPETYCTCHVYKAQKALAFKYPKTKAA